MKLSFVSGFFYPQEGGVERHIYYLSQELLGKRKSKNGRKTKRASSSHTNYELSVICSDKTHTGGRITPHYEKIAGIDVYRERAHLQKHFLTYFPTVGKRLTEIIPDIVHAHSYRHPHVNMAANFARKHGKHMVFTPYAIFPGAAELPKSNIAYYTVYDSLFLRKLFRKMDSVIALTHFEKDMLIQRGVDSKKISVIPCGGYSFEPIKQKKIVEKDLSFVFEKHQGKFIIGALSRIHPSKGIDVMIRALAHLKDQNIVFIFGGKDDGALRDVIELARDLGVSHMVEFVGFVNKYKKYFYENLDLFVSPSKAEALGMTLVEAQAVGTPVIGSDFGPIRETMLDDVTGYLVPYGDYIKLAARIRELINDESRRLQFSKLAKKRASFFSWKNLTKCIEKVYAGEQVDLYSKIKL